MSTPSPDAFRKNWDESDLPLVEKLRLLAKNNAIKVQRASSCCGNHGEPGC